MHLTEINGSKKEAKGYQKLIKRRLSAFTTLIENAERAMKKWTMQGIKTGYDKQIRLADNIFNTDSVGLII